MNAMWVSLLTFQPYVFLLLLLILFVVLLQQQKRRDRQLIATLDKVSQGISKREEFNLVIKKLPRRLRAAVLDFIQRHTNFTRHGIFLEHIAEHLPDVYYSLDSNFQVRFISKNCKKIFGIENKEFLKDSTHLILNIHPGDMHFALRKLEHIKAGKTYFYTYRIISQDGSVYTVEDRGQAVKDPQGRLLRIVGVIRDISIQKDLEKALLEKEKTVQREVAQELHDNLGQQLIGLSFFIKTFETQVQKGILPQPSQLTVLNEMTKKSVSLLKQISRGLNQFDIDDSNFIQEIERFCKSVSDLQSVRCQLRFFGTLGTVGEVYLHHMFRIMQEAVNNSLQHGKASVIQVNIICHATRIVLSVSDNGKGFELIDGQGAGLKIMHHRANQIGAKIDFFRSPAGGMDLILSLKRINL